jgi:hypothetical protein
MPDWSLHQPPAYPSGPTTDSNQGPLTLVLNLLSAVTYTVQITDPATRDWYTGVTGYSKHADGSPIMDASGSWPAFVGGSLVTFPDSVVGPQKRVYYSNNFRPNNASGTITISAKVSGVEHLGATSQANYTQTVNESGWQAAPGFGNFLYGGTLTCFFNVP